VLGILAALVLCVVLFGATDTREVMFSLADLLADTVRHFIHEVRS
jgi:hypothetical protein